MREAPAQRAAITVSAPIGPQPVTSTFLPSSGPARRTACSATANGSAIAPSRSLRLPASLNACAVSTTISRRNAPCTCGVRIALP